MIPVLSQVSLLRTREWKFLQLKKKKKGKAT